MNRLPLTENILTNKTANGVGMARLIADYKNVQLSLVGSGTAAFTVKIQGSLSVDAPDFSSPPSLTNRWGYIASIDYNNPANLIVGSTGIVFAGDAVRNLLVNVDGLNWLNCEVSNHSTGRADADVVMFTNQ